MPADNIKVLITAANSTLAKRLSISLHQHLIAFNLLTYPNGEIAASIQESLENKGLYLIHLIEQPLHESFMQLLMLIHAAKERKASRIHVILPYFPYARQDYSENGQPSLALIVRLLESAGAHSVATFDLHSPKTADFFTIPLHHLSFIEQIAEDCQKQQLSDFVIVSPDEGGIDRVATLAAKLNVPFATLDKQRDAPGNTKILSICGNVQNKLCLIFDDLVDSGNTLCMASDALLQAGALRCEAYVTHSLLSTQAIAQIQSSSLSRLTVSDTCPSLPLLDLKIRVLSIAQDIVEYISIPKTINKLFLNEIF